VIGSSAIYRSGVMSLLRATTVRLSLLSNKEEGGGMAGQSSEHWLAKAEELRSMADELDDKMAWLSRTRRVNPHLDAELEAIMEAQRTLRDRAALWESMASFFRPRTSRRARSEGRINSAGPAAAPVAPLPRA
jgi:hypothetical protein